MNHLDGLMISDHAMNLITLWAMALAFPVVAIGKWYLSQVMRRNTFLRTSIGDWLVKMFIAIGFAFFCIGLLSALTLTDIYQWWTIPLWGRWMIRIGAVLAAVMSLVATASVVHALLPLLRSPLVIDRQYTSEHHV